MASRFLRNFMKRTNGFGILTQDPQKLGWQLKREKNVGIFKQRF